MKLTEQIDKVDFWIDVAEGKIESLKDSQIIMVNMFGVWHAKRYEDRIQCTERAQKRLIERKKKLVSKLHQETFKEPLTQAFGNMIKSMNNEHNISRNTAKGNS